jgi:hypothetical protein
MYVIAFCLYFRFIKLLPREMLQQGQMEANVTAKASQDGFGALLRF